jgi:peptidoglycan/LPS O-acetylase OafA/YrhL
MFIVSCFALCAMMIAVRPPLPLGRVFILLGTCSYSLFLFHLGFYRLLELVGINVPDSRASIAYTLLLSPLLIIFCVWLEKGVKKFHQRIKGIMPVDLGGAASAPVLAPAPASGAASTDRESS